MILRNSPSRDRSAQVWEPPTNPATKSGRGHKEEEASIPEAPKTR